MDPSKLQTASTYINNLLLARGLLRSGTPIEFAQLASTADKTNKTSTDKSTTTTSTTTNTAAAEIINLVHDLILRRDRDQDHTESLAHTLHTLRSDSSALTSQVSRLKSENADLTRQLSLSQAAARAAQVAAHTADAAARTLREEVARVKTVLAQVRTQCANDVRKRDVQIQKLKGHLEARQRGGNKNGAVGASITIVPGMTGRANVGSDGRGSANSVPSLEDTEYSLRQESTEFLTQLSQSLSDENDALISLVRGALGTLKELQGLPHNRMEQARYGGSHVSSKGRYGRPDEAGAEQMVQSVAVSYQSLSVDLEGVLQSLTDLLTNPSFAPVEEVHIREEEIQRLKEGWEKMESRWTEAVVMMQGWQKRMLSGGDTVNLDELKQGLVLGEGLDSPSRRNLLSPTEGGERGELVDSPRADEAGLEELSGEENAADVDDLPEFEEDLEEVEAPIFADRAENGREAGSQLHGQHASRSRHLQERDANTVVSRHTAATEQVREGKSPVSPSKARYPEAGEDSSPLPAKPTISKLSSGPSPSKQPAPAPTAQAPHAKQVTYKKASTMPRPRKVSHYTFVHLTKLLTYNFYQNQIPKPTTSSLRSAGTNNLSPRPSATTAAAADARSLPKAQQRPRVQRPPEPVLTVEEKLQLASREAEARRLQSSSPCTRPESSRSAKREQIDRASRPDPVDEGGRDKVKPLRHDAPEDEHDQLAKEWEEDRNRDTEPAPVVEVRKRKRVGLGVGLGRPRRRKSTLSPDELQELMGAC